MPAAPSITPGTGSAAARATGSPSAPVPENAELATLLERVARERGLTAGAVPALVAVSRADLNRAAVEQLRSSTPEAARLAIETTLSRLELVPAGFDWLRSLEQALEGRLRAFYDPEGLRIFVDRALTGGDRRRALIHELVHALQDQHHDLGARLAYAPDSWDRHAALHAVAEGDAELLTAHAMAPELETAARPSVDEAPSPLVPEVLLRSLAAVYEDGREFVGPILAAGGFGAVDAVLEAPPATTHELLHPWAAVGERPPLLAPAPAPELTWTLRHTEVLGEQTWRTVLEEWLPGAQAEQVASGWRGDRLSLFARGDATALVWQVRSDAKAHDGARSALRAQFGATRLPTAEGEGVVDPRRRRFPSDFDCRPHRDRGVVGVLGEAHDMWFMSLDDHEAVDATCHTLGSWAARLKLANGTTTRVPSTSSVAADPGRSEVSIGSK